MEWCILLVAGLCEVGWAVSLKFSRGFTRLPASAATVVLLALSMILLGWTVRKLPLGTAYAVWTGIGAVGTAIAGILLFHDSASPLRLFCLALICAGIVGLKFLN